MVPYLVHRTNGERPVKIDADGTVHAAQAPRIYDIKQPLGTIMAQGQKHALVSAMLIKHNGGTTTSAGERPVARQAVRLHHEPRHEVARDGHAGAGHRGDPE